jgi:hypothetical protein
MANGSGAVSGSTGKWSLCLSPAGQALMRQRCPRNPKDSTSLHLAGATRVAVLKVISEPAGSGKTSLVTQWREALVTLRLVLRLRYR